VSRKASRYALKRRGEAEPAQTTNRPSKWERYRLVDVTAPSRSWVYNWRVKGKND
jgi:hypothetical protein